MDVNKSESRSAVLSVLKEATNLVENTKIYELNKFLEEKEREVSSLEVFQADIQKNLTHLKLHIKTSDFRISEVLASKQLVPLNKLSKNVFNKRRNDDDQNWLQKAPIYILKRKQGSEITRTTFPKRIRGTFCYLCGLKSDGMLKCGSSHCPTRFHEYCAKNSKIGGYTYSFMKRNGKLFCSLHHCTGCFADHNRNRCFNGELFACDQCELAWHEDCIPGGCKINERKMITCPRHVVFQDAQKLHLKHCADCQQGPNPGETLFKCTKCFRAVDFKCYSKAKFIKVLDTPEERKNATCHWCDMFDFVRYGEYAMARFSRQKWYPCKVVRNEEFPLKKSPLLGAVGYLCVKWLPFKGKIYYNIISHNRVIAMTHSDYFFITEAHKSDIFEKWAEAQEMSVKNGPCFRRIKDDQIPDQMVSNGERMIKKINHNKYSKLELKLSRERLFGRDTCKCPVTMEDRCGPTSKCINRALCIECPKECSEAPNINCNNRRISEGNNCIEVKIVYFHGKGYGALAMEDIPVGGFVGEYVGEVINKEEKRHRIARIAALQSNEAQYYIMELDDRRSIDAQYYGNDMRYVNHSCNPNCVIQQFQSDSDLHLVLIAKRNILKGEELSFDYNMQRQEGGGEVPICRCGESKCTGVLSADHTARKLGAKTQGRRSFSFPSGKTVSTIAAPPPFSKSVGYKRKQQQQKEEGEEESISKENSPLLLKRARNTHK